MKTRSLILAVQFLVSCSLIAQSWCPPGAVWTYEYNMFPLHYRAEHMYVGDTLLDGRNAQRIEVVHLGTGFGGEPIQGSFTEYTALEDEVVWIYDSSLDTAIWDTLYWLGAVPGDRWWPLGSPADCGPLGMMAVVDTGSLMIDGTMLSTWSVDYLDEDGQPTGNPFQITERIGSTPRIPHILYCGPIIEYFFVTFICYADNEISTGDEPCLLTTSTEEPLIGMENITVYPNPGSTGFSINGLDGECFTCRVLDLQGREVLASQSTGDRNWINTATILPGTYLIDIRTSAGQKQIMKWIKPE